MKNMKNFVTFMTGVALVCASLANLDAKAYEEDRYHGTYETIEEWKDEDRLKCSEENMVKLREIYAIDETNELINAYKWSRVCTSNRAVQAVCMCGYEVGDYFVYRSYVMTWTTYDESSLEITDVSMRWRCVKWEKISECYEWSYA